MMAKLRDYLQKALSKTSQEPVYQQNTNAETSQQERSKSIESIVSMYRELPQEKKEVVADFVRFLSSEETASAKINEAKRTGDDISDEIYYSKEQAVAFLTEKEIKFADKTASGGCFWIISNQDIDTVISKMRIDGIRPRHVDSSKALDGKPGWYVKPQSIPNDEPVQESVQVENEICPQKSAAIDPDNICNNAADLFRTFALKDDPEKRKRKEKSAASAKTTPLDISIQKGTGMFKGEHGQYTTTLTGCSCGSFIRDRLPCKHMYRLAYELGIYNLGAVKSDASQIPQLKTKPIMDIAFDRCSSLLDSYPEKLQQKIQWIMYYHYTKHGDNGDRWHVCFTKEEIAEFEKPIADGILKVVNEPLLIVKTHSKRELTDILIVKGFKFPNGIGTTQKARYEWCIENPETVCYYAFPDAKIITITGDLEIAFTKAYKHLNDKFGTISARLYPELHPSVTP